MDAQPLIHMDGISRYYTMGDHRVIALDSVSIDIMRNEYVAFIGSSGSGKSTMMNIMGCLERPSAGEYVLNERNVGDLSENDLARIRNQEIGFIFQSFNLLTRATALRNVMQPLIYRGMGLAEREQKAMQALRRVDLIDRADHMPNQLSGGQRQRVAIARALVTEPSILLADEPTGNLDSDTTRNIMKLFDELYADGQTLIVVTHEPDIAGHCRRVIELSDGKVKHDYKNDVHTD
ncbi:MAG: ABC transporter ATP-binding protein [Proteobacteria bacterium]|nr:ABC transporter ATP-binding protein [Pseudomonadota bacterium]